MQVFKTQTFFFQKKSCSTYFCIALSVLFNVIWLNRNNVYCIKFKRGEELTSAKKSSWDLP